MEHGYVVGRKWKTGLMKLSKVVVHNISILFYITRKLELQGVRSDRIRIHNTAYISTFVVFPPFTPVSAKFQDFFSPTDSDQLLRRLNG